MDDPDPLWALGLQPFLPCHLSQPSNVELVEVRSTLHVSLCLPMSKTNSTLQEFLTHNKLYLDSSGVLVIGLHDLAPHVPRLWMASISSTLRDSGYLVIFFNNVIVPPSVRPLDRKIHYHVSPEINGGDLLHSLELWEDDNLLPLHLLSPG
jgi:hypothetical protein